MSLRLRVALFTALAVALVEVAIVGSVYALTSYRLYAQTQGDLEDAAAVIARVVETTGDLPARPTQSTERSPVAPRLIASDGRIISTRLTFELAVTDASRAVASGQRGTSLETLAGPAGRYYVLTIPAGSARALQVTRSLGPVEEVLQQLLLVAVALGVAGIAAALVAGAAVATGALAPLRSLSRAAERIRTTGDLTQRVGMKGRDELGRFATTFDAMLDELEAMVNEVERARAAQRQLVADASHELRAPLATLRANVELLNLGRDAPVGDRGSLHDDTLAGIEHLTGLVAQLIDLAREDQRVHERAPVGLDGLVAGEVDRVQRRYSGVSLVTALEPTTVLGDAEALTRAVANLLDNAAKWTPAGGTIQVRLHDRVLEVRDQGPGIDDADLPRIFERFYRGARSSGVPGSGLGLAIVAQVMSSHGGTVSARSGDDGGAIFTARFDSASS